MKQVRIPFGCIATLHFTDFSNFSSFGYKFRGIPKFILFIIHRMGNFNFGLRPGLLYVHAPLSCSCWRARALCSSVRADCVQILPNGC